MDPLFIIRIFWVIVGLVFIINFFVGERLMGALGRKPASEIFQTPRFRRSAKLNEKLGRIFMIPFGIIFLIRGIGPAFLSDEMMITIDYVLTGLVFILILAVISVTVSHWRQEE